MKKDWSKGKPLELARLAEKALREAVCGVILEHAQRKLPLAIWENGKVRHISAKEAMRRWRKHRQ